MSCPDEPPASSTSSGEIPVSGQGEANCKLLTSSSTGELATVTITVQICVYKQPVENQANVPPAARSIRASGLHGHRSSRLSPPTNEVSSNAYCGPHRSNQRLVSTRRWYP